jgi:Zeta toxin
MHHPYARTFRDQDQAEAFMQNVLKFDYRIYPGILSKIVNAEQGLINHDLSEQTLTSTHYRERKYKSEDSRWTLRKQIINQLLSLTRQENDDTINFNIGGAMPPKGIQKGRKAFVVIGLPASGKSSISNIIADTYGAIILDPDYAKRKIPEYYMYACGATLVHDESSAILFGFNDNPNLVSVYEHALLEGYNMVIPKVGNNPDSIKDLAIVLEKAGYETHLILISLKREDATKRAIKRLHDSKRYIPLGLIFDAYGNNPILSYYLLRTKFPNLFKSLGAISTFTMPSLCIDFLNDSPCKNYNIDTTILF